MIPAFVITFNGTNITNYVIKYTRTQELCTGTATCSITVEDTFNAAYSPKAYDVIVVYEDGNKKGTFYIESIAISATSGMEILDCRDESKKMADYFIDQSYMIDYYSTCKYWMEKFLVEAGVSFVFTEIDEGSILSNNTTLGKVTCFEVITTLAQYCGWHFMANPDGVIEIGKIDIDSETHDITLPDEHDILSINLVQDDNILRNRVVVWGAGLTDEQVENENLFFGGNSNISMTNWVYAEASTYTPYNYNQNDLRTAVLSNGNIYSNWEAKVLAERILKYTQHIKYTKEVSIAGFVDTYVGETAFLDTSEFQGWGLITNIDVIGASSGVITTIRLDERCPRLYAHFDTIGDGYGYSNNYIYIATQGQGVWRKRFSVDGWTNYSEGLGDLNVTDLAVNKLTLACVTADGSLYARNALGGSWIKLNPSVFIATLSGQPELQVIPEGSTDDPPTMTYSSSDVVTMACDINQFTNEIISVQTLKNQYALVSGVIQPVFSGAVSPFVTLSGTLTPESFPTYSGNYSHSWVTTFQSPYSYDTEEVFVNGSDDVFAYDICTDSFTNYIVALTKLASGVDNQYRYNPQHRSTPRLQSLLQIPTSDGLNAIGYTVVDGGVDVWGDGEPIDDLPRSLPAGGNCCPDETDEDTSGSLYPGTISGGFEFSDVEPDGTFTVNVLSCDIDAYNFADDPPQVTPDPLYPGLGVVGASVTLINEEISGVQDNGIEVTISFVHSLYATEWHNGIPGALTDNYDYRYYYVQVYLITSEGTALLSSTKWTYRKKQVYWMGTLPGTILELEDGITGNEHYWTTDIEAYADLNFGMALEERDFRIGFTGLYDGTYTLKNSTGGDYANMQLRDFNGIIEGALYQVSVNSQQGLFFGLIRYTSGITPDTELIAFQPESGFVYRRFGRTSYGDTNHIRYVGRVYRNAIYISSYPYWCRYYPAYVFHANGQHIPLRDAIAHGVAKRTEEGDYLYLAQTPMITHIEASKDNPLVAFGGNEVMGYGFLQAFPYGYRDDTINIFTYLNVPDPYGEDQDTYIPAPTTIESSTVSGLSLLTPSYIPDARVFDWLDGSTASSYRYIGFTKIIPSGTGIYGEGGDLEGVSITLSGVGDIYRLDFSNSINNNILYPAMSKYDMLAVCSGVVLSKLETTNTQDIPYIFTCTAGENPRFFERMASMEGGTYIPSGIILTSSGIYTPPGTYSPSGLYTASGISNNFVEYNLNLPSGVINAIRADDMV